MKPTKKLHVKITIRFVVLFSAALLAFLMCTLPLITRSLSAELEMVTRQKMDIVSSQIDNALQEIRSLWFSMVRDPQMQELVHDYPDAEDPQQIVLQLHNRLNQLISPHAGIRSAIFISPRAQVLDPIYGTEPYDALLLQEGEYKAFLDSQLFARFSAVNTFPYTSVSPSFEERNTVTLMGCFFDTETYDNLGTLALNCSRLSFLEQVQPALVDGFDHMFLMDQSGQIVMDLFSGRREIPQSLRTARNGDVVQTEGHSQAVFYRSLPDYPSWTLVTAVDYGTIRQPIYTLLVLIFCIALLVVISVAMTSAHLSNQITQPLRAVAGAMQQVKSGRWEKVEKIQTGDELENLQDGYNEMVASLERLTQRLAQEQNQKNQIKITMLQSRLDMLQSQINPHFIHNTLNTMNYLAQKEQALELSRLIVSFNGLLRSSMSTSTMFYTVEEEMENIRRFVHILQVRYDMDLRCIYHVEPRAETAMIPKLILQPLVENSLFHGILPKGGGTVTVHAALAEGRLWIELCDDGVGIPPQQLEQILSGTAKNPRGYSSIGLANVFDRLILTYGEASRPVVQSQENWGTIISFSIPQEGEPLENLTEDDNIFDKR